jgi:hypothetical protein
MQQEVTSEAAQSEQSEANTLSNISASEYVQRRLGAIQNQEQPQEEVQETEEAPVVEEEVEEVVEPVDESTTEETMDEESSEDVLSQLSLDEMSDEELRELSDKLGSRAVARFGELTAKRKAAEEKVQALEAELNKQNPLDREPEVADNPYSDLNSLEDLQEKAQEVNKVIEWAEEVLFNADEYGANDEITVIEGKGLTKSEVRKSLLNARKSRDKYLPAQLKSVQKIEQAKVMKSGFEEQAKKELAWMQGEDNDTRKRYEAMINDPRFVKLEETVDPEIGAQLNYIIAHAANSIYGRRPIKETATSPAINPPKTGTPSASQSEKTVNKSSKAVKDLSQRFKTSGKKSDFISLRTLQLSNR